ncbi:MAG: YgaP family membrane protein [Elusimicrobiota bacterium]
MTLDRRIRLIAGSFVLISLGLAHWVNPKFLWFTAFVGVNLLQSSITRWCLMEDILKALGWAG